MKKLVLLLTMLAALSSISQAQTINQKETTEPILKYQAGAFAGISQGFGMSFRFWPEKFGTQFTFTPVVDEYFELYSLGFSLLHWVSKGEKIGLYAYQGNHLLVDIDRDIREPDGSKRTRWDNQYYCGLGFGAQINLVTRFKLDITTGFVAMNNFQRLRTDLGIGLFYEF
ncbi:hypothetical protein [Halocola ammonii]